MNRNIEFKNDRRDHWAGQILLYVLILMLCYIIDMMNEIHAFDVLNAHFHTQFDTYKCLPNSFPGLAGLPGSVNIPEPS